MGYIRRRVASVGGSGVDLVGAFVAGLAVGFTIAWLRAFGEEIDVSEFLRIMFLATSSYSMVALLFWRECGLRRSIPRWVIISIVGSVVTYLSVNLIGAINYIWRFKDSSVIGYATGAIQDEIIDLLLSTIMNSLIALPVIGTIHYAASRVLMTRNTHD